MTRFIAMEDGANGFDTADHVRFWIKSQPEHEQGDWRVVVIQELTPNVESIGDKLLAKVQREIEAAYIEGKEYERARIRSLLGLGL